MKTHSSVSLCCVPVPVVPQAVNDVLTVQKPDGEAGITVEVRWPLMAANQQSSLHVFGQNTDGSPRALLVADAEPVTEQEVEQGWSRPVLWEQLQGLKEGSDLISVFKVAQGDSACACPVLFPSLSLKVKDNYEYEDKTTFSENDGTDDWSGWMRGEAGSDPRDLIIRASNDIYVLHNHTHTHNSAGTILIKRFVDLKVGHIYEFGITVRRWNSVPAIPMLSLLADTFTVVPATGVETLEWIELKGTFTANASVMALSIVNDVATGYGNDYAFREIWVKSL